MHLTGGINCCGLGLDSFKLSHALGSVLYGPEVLLKDISTDTINDFGREGACVVSHPFTNLPEPSLPDDCFLTST
jgi:hypothetical protein